MSQEIITLGNPQPYFESTACSIGSTFKHLDDFGVRVDVALYAVIPDRTKDTVVTIIIPAELPNGSAPVSFDIKS